MQCKNCGSSLRTDYSYCPNCGAKVIRNRITVKNLWYDIIERYFNLDNSFLRTLRDMIVRPGVVCHSYVSGIRKRYLNPISLLAISLTLSGVILFIMKSVSWDTIDFTKLPFSNGAGSEKVMSVTMEYSSMLFLFFIPLFAFCGFLLLNKKNYNLPEHIIIATYALAAFSIIMFPYSVITLLVAPQSYMDISFYYSLLMIAYCLYVSYKNSPVSFAQLAWRAPTYMLLFTIGYFGVSIIFTIVLLLTGAISIGDVTPKT